MSNEFLTIFSKPEWQSSANCKGQTEILYAIHTPSARRGKRKILIKIANMCEKCPVSTECLLYACETNQEFGVWASFTPDQIKKLSSTLIDVSKVEALIVHNIQQLKEVVS
jgi:hypothetical protein